MIVESILAGSFVGIAGIAFGVRQGVLRARDQKALSHERQVNASLEFLIEAKNENLAVLQKQIDDDKSRRQRIAQAGGKARGQQQRDEKMSRRAATIDAVAATPLRPRDEVVAEVRAARAEKDDWTNIARA